MLQFENGFHIDREPLKVPFFAEINTMTMKPKYKTKQREVLLSYLRSTAGNHITAGDVCEYFKEQGTPIGQATVYRQLESLVDEGIMNKYHIDANSPACFEYVEEETHGGEAVCFHAKCGECGKLIHLHCEEILKIKNHLLKDHGFVLDDRRTVFYGLCEDCAKSAE